MTLGTEGADQSVSRTATTEGGLSLSAGVSNIDIDLTNPTVTYTGGKAGYQVDEQVSITCSAADAFRAWRRRPAQRERPCVLVRPRLAHVQRERDRQGWEHHRRLGERPVVTYTPLNLSRQFSSNQGIGNALCALLQLAEAADSHNSPTLKKLSLQAYVLLVRAQTGRALTASEAATLIALSQAL